MAEKIEVEKFKELFLEMYRGFPEWFYSAKDIEEKLNPFALHILLKGNYLTPLTVKKENKEEKYFMLGANALSLISSWKNERTSNRIENLTNILIIFTGILFGVGTYPFFKDLFPTSDPLTNLLTGFVMAGSIMLIVYILFDKRPD